MGFRAWGAFIRRLPALRRAGFRTLGFEMVQILTAVWGFGGVGFFGLL